MKPNQQRTSQGFHIQNYISQESWSGIILVIVTLVAIMWANSAWYSSYHNFWHELKFGISLGDFELKKSLQHWINDGLMAIFFFTVGLEIKREVLAGEFLH